MAGTSWLTAARKRRETAYVRSKGHAEAIEAFRRACELTLAPKGVHGTGFVEVAPYEYKTKELQGTWVTYRIELRTGEPSIRFHGYEDEDAEYAPPKHRRRYPRQGAVNPATGEKQPVIGLALAQDFIQEVAASLLPYHRGQATRWFAEGVGVSGKGQLKPIGEKTLAGTKDYEAAASQATARVDDWLNGIVYSSSDIGAVSEIKMMVRVA